MKKKKKKG